MTLSIERPSNYQPNIAEEVEGLPVLGEFGVAPPQKQVRKIGLETVMVTLGRGIPAELQSDDNQNVRLGTD